MTECGLSVFPTYDGDVVCSGATEQEKMDNYCAWNAYFKDTFTPAIGTFSTELATCVDWIDTTKTEIDSDKAYVEGAKLYIETTLGAEYVGGWNSYTDYTGKSTEKDGCIWAGLADDSPNPPSLNSKWKLISCVLITPPTIATNDNVTVEITSDLTTSSYFTGTHEKTVARAFSDAEHQVLIDEQVLISGNLNQISFNNLPLDTDVFVQVAVGSDNHLSSFTNIAYHIPISYVEAPVFALEADANGLVGKNPSVTISTLPAVVGSGNSIDKVSFRVIKVADGTEVGATQTTTDMTLPIILISNDLEVSIEYRFEVMCEVVGEVQSLWSITIATTKSYFSINPLSPDPLEDGSLVAKYMLDDNPYDITGNFDGTEQGTMSYAIAKFENGQNASGAKSGLVIPWAVLSGTENRTISLFVKLDTEDTTTFLGFDYDGQRGLGIYYTKNGTTKQIYDGSTVSQNEWHIYSGGDNNVDNIATISYADMPISTFVHCVFVFNLPNVEVYIDGVSIGNVDVPNFTTFNPNYNFDVYLGCNNYNDAVPANGTVFDQVETYNRILTPTEIEKLTLQGT